MPRRTAGFFVAVALAGAVLLQAQPAPVRFLADDPLSREPDTQDASRVEPWDIDLSYDLAHAYTVTSRRKPRGIRALNVNSIDEVPDSSWFTNRIGSRPVSLEEIARGPVVAPAPVPSQWTVLREKSAGAAPGFTAEDAGGGTWFVSFDAPANPEGATAAVVISTKLFWALGYNQVEYHVSEFDPARIQISPRATKRRPSGRRTPMSRDDIDDILSRSRRTPEGHYRVATGRLLSGKVLGGFRYEGTRPDDPNDVVDHEHRRELRALRVFGAWTNLTDVKAGNTLDTLVEENGRQVVRHYLQDVGSTFGVGANGPHDWSEGWEYVMQAGPAFRRLFSLGFAFSPWQLGRIETHPSVGRFEGDRFDPLAWVPRAPVSAFLEMRDDDAFWAARKVMAFSDEAIRAAVSTGRFTDPQAAALLERVLVKRRDRIGQAFLPRINPIVDPVLTSDSVRFGNTAVDHGVSTAPRRYLARWFRFDNGTGTSQEVGTTTGQATTLAAPRGLPDEPGAFVRVDLSAEHDAHTAWRRPVETYFRRDRSGWTLVGLFRQAAEARPTGR